MKRTVVIALSLLSASVIAESAAELTPAEKAARRAHMLENQAKKTGGFIARPGSLKGEVCYVNCQNRAPRAWIDESVAYFADQSKFRVLYKDGSFDFAAPKIEGNATLFVIDDPKMPALLVAPENRWAFVNVAVIAREQRPAFFEARVKKQLSRAFAYLCGASNSQYPRALTRGIVNEADLDQNHDYKLPFDVLQRFRTYMEPLGVTPEVHVTYRKAVQEGWAPAPTNEYQKAIWDKVHALPASPIKIKPETKKVTE